MVKGGRLISVKGKGGLSSEEEERGNWEGLKKVGRGWMREERK